MYDLDWARSIYKHYIRLCTRAYQTDLCIQFMAKTNHNIDISLEIIKKALIYSIRQRGSGGHLWQVYKAYNKSKCLNRAKLQFMVTKVTYYQLYTQDKALQQEFDNFVVLT